MSGRAGQLWSPARERASEAAKKSHPVRRRAMLSRRASMCARRAMGTGRVVGSGSRTFAEYLTLATTVRGLGAETKTARASAHEC